jgi:uncharacterized protein involved in oxidation of intracellular sulfur
MKMLLILNDPAYGTERSYNGLRLARELAGREETDLKVFLLADAVGCAMAGQDVPDGYYHLDRMIGSAARLGAEFGCCGICLDARGLTDEMLIDDVRRSTMTELGDWTVWADKVVTF